ncbi:tetratricopeptide repeat protein [Undibacterium cyanobacteriorum]|uniref:Tetratricopeptide repeat protein n=1 Tax=Undibacterium cyanobacteriorum TaxID=3073561 RepID=A0ABY9RM65_9BURK|nr:tetratricopeptide repeat protein [Undibacterium sp. 20NA77.5]WMW82308.1 tetratricopeptide repeat protein [Undibacterium sp. 20NA77.5]
MRTITKSALAIASLLASLYGQAAFADDASDASKLYKAGQLNEALKKIDAALTQKPKDAQMRFLKGIILTEQNKSAEAITIFTKLTEDFPELPEPYNNLAVLYASNGQYQKASVALEMAIRTNPTYGTAHENLGDVYAKLASQSYDKALQLDSNNATAKLKLNLVKNLIGNTTGGTNPKLNPPAAPTPTTTPVAAAAPMSPTSSAVTKAPEPKPENKAPSKPAAPVINDKDNVITTVESWAKAWSNQDVNKYLAHYAKDFQTPNGESRSAWADDRRSRIEGKGKISVRIEDLSVKVDDNSATVRFKQYYSSDRLSSTSRKVLVMTKHDGKWLIKQERSGS